MRTQRLLGLAAGVCLALGVLPAAASADDPPTCSPPPSAVKVRTGVKFGIGIGCTDPATIVVSQGPSHGVLAEVSSSGFYYTSASGYQGPDNVTFHASTPAGDSPDYTVSLDVGADVNYAPAYCQTRQADDNVRLGATRTFTLVCTDLDGDPIDPGSLTVSANDVRDTATGVVTGPDTVAITFTAGANGTAENEVQAIHYRLSDAPPSPATAHATSGDLWVTYKPSDYDSPPECSAPSETIRVASHGPTVIRPSCEDPEGDPFSLNGTTPDHGFVGADPADPTQLLYTPATGVAGAADSFTFTAIDTPPDGIDQLESRAVPVSVQVNNPPQCTTAGGTSAGDAPVTILLTCTDADPGDTLSLTAGPAGHGTVAVAGNPAPGQLSIRYTPAAGFAGTEHLTYAASDGIESSEPADVTISVTAPSVQGGGNSGGANTGGGNTGGGSTGGGTTAPTQPAFSAALVRSRLDDDLARLFGGMAHKRHAGARKPSITLTVPATLQTSGTLHVTLSARLTRHGRPQQIAAASVVTSPGHATKLKLRLSGKAAAKLRHGRLTATLRASLADTASSIARGRQMAVTITR